MKTLAALLIAGLLCGCVSDAATPIIATPGVHQVSTANGSGEIGAFYIGPFPWTYPIRWQGNGRMTIQYPAQPHLLLEGDLVWEPVFPEQRQAIEQQIALGNFQPPER